MVVEGCLRRSLRLGPRVQLVVRVRLFHTDVGCPGNSSSVVATPELFGTK
jgi:hypothetical protein